jgi:uncharacterized NAD-dependent epimerase/dehydratase family protein
MTVGGEVLVAGAAEYESARRSQIARFDGVRPHAIVRCRVPEDIAQALARVAGGWSRSRAVDDRLAFPPAAWRAMLLEAIEAGLDIEAGLHTLLSDDE